MSEDNRYEFLENEEYFLKLRLVIGVLMAKMKKNFGKVCLMLLKKSKEKFAKYGCLVDLHYPRGVEGLNKQNFR